MGLWLFGAGQVYVGVGRGGGGEEMSTGVAGIEVDGFRMSWMFLDTPCLVNGPDYDLLNSRLSHTTQTSLFK